MSVPKFSFIRCSDGVELPINFVREDQVMRV